MSRKRKNEISDEKLNSWLVWAISATAIVVIVISGILIFLSVGGSNKQEAVQGFYSSEVSAGNAQPASESEASSKSSEEEEETEETTASSSKENTTGGATITVQAGEGEAAIAARAGISIAELEALNPGNMRTGSWYANPGDEVRVE
ncbi:SAG1386/EF1546 family surface-associated protein [Streptococcus danieliae]|uniref:SAG1386/EF1546 family surface-associated protein n=1 Tax=Streptococcus danieliae TaxID=747656 RepID=UPI001D1615A7|nr:SAG1386/EF1546 family surface-associated protein [Streptococcus danieliae]